MLIDTIIVSKLSVHKIFVSQEGGHFYIEDGGHRLHSCREFIHNEFPVKIGNDWVFYDDETKNLQKKEVAELEVSGGDVRKLTEQEKTRFLTFKFNVDIFVGYSPRQLGELFERLNKGERMKV